MNKCSEYADLVGRALIGAIFVFAGYGKIMGFEGTKAYMQSSMLNVFGATIVALLLVLTIILEVGGGLMLILGYKTRHIAFLLAGFLVLATIVFHMGPGQSMNLTKNIMIIGGLLILSANGASRLSLDSRCGSDCKNCSCEEKCENKDHEHHDEKKVHHKK